MEGFNNLMKPSDPRNVGPAHMKKKITKPIPGHKTAIDQKQLMEERLRTSEGFRQKAEQ